MRTILQLAFVVSLFCLLVLILVWIGLPFRFVALALAAVITCAVVLGVWGTRALDRHLASVLKNRDEAHIDAVLRDLPDSERKYVQRQIDFQVGLCEHCGYDLRASEERCPECGWLIPKSFKRRTS